LHQAAAAERKQVLHKVFAEGRDGYLIFVYNIALVFIAPSLMTVFILDNLINRDVA
jgi:hypothetical protein